MATDCETCCAELQCEVDAIKLNIGKLFGRTDDLNGAVETFSEESQHVYRVVHNSEELEQALGLGISVWVDAPIIIGQMLDIDVDGFQMRALNDSAAIILQHNNTSALNVLKVSAKNVKIIGMKITTNHPLTYNETINDVGILISDTEDVSGLVIENCEIYNVYHGIFRAWNSSGGTYAPESTGVKIQENYIHSILGFGLYLQQHFNSLDIVGNVLIGEVETQDTHLNEGNGMWLGNNSNYVNIERNRITRFGRHGIEFWNSQHIPIEYTEGNRSCKILGNSIWDMQNHTGGTLQNFLISAFGNESLLVAHNTCIGGDIGIELYNDRVTDGEVHVHDNFISGTSNQGMSVNGVRNGKIHDNTLRDIPAIHGMQIINGCRDTAFENNRFYDAGERNIFVNAFGLTITAIQLAANGWITVAENMASGANFYTWMLGRQVTFKDIVGTTELNDNFYTITEIDASGAVGTHKIRLGIDTSAFTPWVSGGYFKESYRNLIFQDNKFYHNKLIGSSGNVQSIYVSDVSSSLFRGNTAWYVDSISPNKFYANGYLSIFIDAAGAAVTATGYFVGDNRVIPFKASN